MNKITSDNNFFTSLKHLCINILTSTTEKNGMPSW